MSQNDLNDRIAKAQAEIDARNRSALQSTGKGMGLGFRMASDFAAAVIVGVVVGLGIDAVFKVSPWATIICLMLGFLAGVRNVVATAMKANQAPEKGDVEKGEGDSA
jgi:ATP synthase protein I